MVLSENRNKSKVALSIQSNPIQSRPLRTHLWRLRLFSSSSFFLRVKIRFLVLSIEMASI